MKGQRLPMATENKPIASRSPRLVEGYRDRCDRIWNPRSMSGSTRCTFRAHHPGGRQTGPSSEKRNRRRDGLQMSRDGLESSNLGLQVRVLAQNGRSCSASNGELTRSTRAASLASQNRYLSSDLGADEVPDVRNRNAVGPGFARLAGEGTRIGGHHEVAAFLRDRIDRQ